MLICLDSIYCAHSRTQFYHIERQRGEQWHVYSRSKKSDKNNGWSLTSVQIGHSPQTPTSILGELLCFCSIVYKSTKLHSHKTKLKWPKQFFVPGYKHVYFCCKVGLFNLWMNGDWLTFGASLKWPFKELQFGHFPIGFIFQPQRLAHGLF